MLKFIYRILGTDESQGKRVILMIVMGFFAGIFLATFSVASETLFLQNFDPQRDLPIGIVASGVFGLFATVIYSFLQGRISYRSQISAFLTVITGMVILLTLGYKYLPDIKVIVFLTFIANGPFAALLMLIFWGTFNRLFTLKEAKEIIGNIDTGTLIASLLSFFSIPIIVQFLKNAYDLYYISVGGIIVAFISLIVIARSYDLDRQTTETAGEKVKRYSYPRIFRDRYTRLMSVFVIVSMICVAFINFSFLNVTSQQFPDQNDLAGFLSLFGGTVIIFSFLFQTFFTDRIIASYGLKVALLIDPILLGILTVGSVIVGSIFGFSASAGNFIIFFLVIAMAKLFLDSLKDALDSPSFKLYFLPLPAAVKFDVQSKIEGAISVFAGLIAGGIMILFNHIKSFNLLTVVIAVIPAVAIWYFITQRMHRSYRETLKNSLETNKSKTKEQTSETGGNDLLLTGKVNSDEGSGGLFALNLMERIEPVLFESSIQNLRSSGNQHVQKYLDRGGSSGNAPGDELNIPGKISSSETFKLALMALDSQETSEVTVLDPKQLLRMAKSPDPEERIQVALMLRKILSEENTFVLIELLRDVHPRVKIAAIQTARIRKVETSWPFLVDLLGSLTYSHHAFAALVAMGEEVLPYLEKAFHRSDQSAEVMLKIAKIYERIGGEQAIDLLWEKIDYPDKELLTLILNSLHNNRYTVPVNRIVKIKTLLENTLGYTLWNLAAAEELKDTPRNKLIRDAISEEIAGNFERIYLLLGLMYDPQSVNLVRKNIELGSSESVTFALELLDIFIDKDMKRLVFPILDDISVEEKLKVLQDDFPRDRFDEVQVLKQILNRDFNQINQWTKACALYTLNQIPDFEVSDSIVAHIFNPDSLLRQMAAWLIRSKDPELYRKLTFRLKRETRNELNEALSDSGFSDKLTDSLSLRFEKILFLKSTTLFREMPGYLIAEITEKMEYREFNPQKLFSRIDHFPADLFIVTHGKVNIYGPDNFNLELKKGDAMGEIMIPEKDASQIKGAVEEPSGLLWIGSGHLFNLMAKHEEITRIFITAWDKLVSRPEAVTQ